MARDWSATRQAEENISTRQYQQREDVSRSALKSSIAEVNEAISHLHSVDVSDNDVDLAAAYRALGSLLVRLERDLHRMDSK